MPLDGGEVWFVTGSQEMYGEAAERGPVVLCLESVDLAAASEGVIGDVGEVRLDPKTPLRLVDGAVLARFRALGRPAGPWPYRSEPTASSEPGPAIKVPLIPYHEWGRARSFHDAGLAAGRRLTG